MKKVCIFAGLVLAVFVIFACTIPTSLEIKATPKIKFAANMDFNEMFEEMMSDAFNSGDSENEFTIQDCVNVDIRTFLIRMDVIKLENENFGDDSIPNKIVFGDVEIDVTNLDDQGFTLSKRIDLASNTDEEPIRLNFGNFGGNLSGFSFSEEPVKAKVFLDGTEIVGAIYIDLFLGDEEKIEIEDIGLGTSGIDLTSNEYTETSLPAGGKDINIASLLNSKEEIGITYNVYIPENTIIQVDWLKNADIVVEMLVWVPLDLEAGNDGAELSFLDNVMGGIGDFVNSIAETADSLSLVIEMSQNPFAEGKLVVRSGDIIIENPLSSTALNFVISEEDMKAIVEAESFEPEFAIVFDRGKHLKVPRELKMTTISLEAKIRYIIEF